MAEKKEAPKGFETIVYYRTWAKMLRALPAELRCKIRDAIDDYIIDETEPDDETVLYSAFPLILDKIKEDKARYNKICEQNRDKMRERWAKVKNEQ